MYRAWSLAMLLACNCAALADDDVELDMEFFEYLGMWQDSDEEWLLIDEPTATVNDARTEPAQEGSDARTDPAQEGKWSAETDDES